MARSHVSCSVNGDEVDFLATGGTSLLDSLRDELGLTGVKEGCGTGDCGACSILVDGKLNCSCLMFSEEAEGTAIMTVEGLANGDQLHPLQQCFLEGAALQCGICTPGFLIAAKALLDENPDPTETEIRYALAGNLCRCTGYDKIIRSVQEAAVQIREVAK
jgi:carbon-monoxide dehydrogenase small subunit